MRWRDQPATDCDMRMFVVGEMAASGRTVVRRLLAGWVFAMLGVAIIAAEAAAH